MVAVLLLLTSCSSGLDNFAVCERVRDVTSSAMPSLSRISEDLSDDKRRVLGAQYLLEILDRVENKEGVPNDPEMAEVFGNWMKLQRALYVEWDKPSFSEINIENLTLANEEFQIANFEMIRLCG